MRAYATRRAIGRMLNILQVGESVAQNVCAKLVLLLPEEDYRNHAAAQAMDEARHHLAYRRFIAKMGEPLEDIDGGTEMMFDSLLASDDPLELIATEQFFLESLAMNIFEGIQQHATHPLLRDVLALITRDESRHMGFGVLFLEQWLRASPLERRVAFAHRWLGQILGALLDKPGPIFLARVARRLKEAGMDPAEVDALAPQMLREQQEVNAREIAAAASGEKVPHLLKSARRVGLLEPDILDALGVAEHPLIRGALRGGEAVGAAS
ncbi:MAG: ferritin-like domain-containing protein [Thermodesulfobacteriota bacterium]